MVETLSVFIKYFLVLFDGVALTLYYSSFLLPKNNKIPARYILTGFSVSFFVIQYLIKQALAGLPTYIALTGGTIVLGLSVFGLALLFFENKLKVQAFLLCSFFAVREIALLISFSVFSILANINSSILSLVMQFGALTTLQKRIAFIDSYSIVLLVLLLLLYVIILVLSLQYLKKRYVYKYHEFSLPEILYLIFPCFSGFSISIIMKLILYNPNGGGMVMLFKDIPFIGFLMPLVGVILLFSILAAVNFFQKLIQLHIEDKEKAVLQKQMQQLEEQIRDIDGVYTEIKGIRHDMKSHLANIQLLAKSVMPGNQNVGKEMEDYINKLGATLNKLEFAFQTGNSITDVIIHQKYLEAIKYGIHFSADFVYPASLNIASYNLAVILNNSLENAIAACNKLPRADRFIRLYSYVKGTMFFIEIENSFKGYIHFNEHTGLPISNKKDNASHGMGLSNIQRCARDYFGDIDIQISNTQATDIFRLIIMLQGKIA